MKVCKCSENKKEEKLVEAGQINREGVYKFVVERSEEQAYLIVLGSAYSPIRLYYNARTGDLVPLEGASVLMVKPCTKKVCFELKD